GGRDGEAGAGGAAADRGPGAGGICFRKRLAGLEKKAEELAVLCDAHVGFVVLSCSDDDRLHHFAAPATIENIVERYENSLTAQKGVHGRRTPEKRDTHW
ncbi:Os04g0387300, partial [Oryza sativa Japonica Group]